MDCSTTNEAMVAWSQSRRRDGRTIGLVPTMGFLHRGHMSLMALLRPLVDDLVVSIYVNPLQFGPGEDLDCYPRDTEGDLAKCQQQGVDCVFVPQDIYPDGFCTSVAVGGLTSGLCGADRPTHFEGVTTVVARLFGLVGCQFATFGEKDYQQLMVLRQMVSDLSLNVRIVPGALIRDDDGLALSSRNKYLSLAERKRALSLHRALFAMGNAAKAETEDVTALLELGRGNLTLDPGDDLHYLELVDAVNLQRVEQVRGPCRALIAAVVGRTRLIDNVAVGPELTWT